LKSVFDVTKNVIILTAIAKPKVFVRYLKEKKLKIEKNFDFPDHHSFSRKDIDKVLGKSNENMQIITTEKDMVKLKPQLSDLELKQFFYVPIEIELENKIDFEAFINTKIEFFNKNNS
jgi:tetraacyldisaccharide 4'-kinase